LDGADEELFAAVAVVPVGFSAMVVLFVVLSAAATLALRLSRPIMEDSKTLQYGRLSEIRFVSDKVLQCEEPIMVSKTGCNVR
jgi:hypothetical protein